MLVGQTCQSPLTAPPSTTAAGAEDGWRPVFDGSIDRYRALSSWLVGGIVAIAALLALRSGISADVRGMGLVAQMLGAALLASAFLWTNSRLSRIADALGTLGLAWMAGLAGGVISLVGLRFRHPLVDDALLRLDRAFGIDTPALAGWLASHSQWPITITMSYNYTVPVLCLSVLVQSLLGKRLEAWRAAFCFVGSLLTVCLISILTPAKGLGTWMTDDVLARLPNGAATYFWPSFDRFYSGTDPVLTLDAIDGVVSFPSFHTAMGLITVSLWRKSPMGVVFASSWFALMMIGTIPLGGHYVVDLIGGAFIWWCWFLLSRRLEVEAPQAV